MKFKSLGLDPKVLEAISYMGFDTATPIQAEAIPYILANKDVIGCAQTGTGKTAAFVLPILHKLVLNKSAFTDTLIIVPTWELANQIDQQIQGLSYFLPVSSLAIYGGGRGSDWEVQKKALTKGTDIIVATPGKLLSHLNMGYVNFNNISHFILDEADRMLDMGFVEDIKKIITHLPEKRQTLMFSATMSHDIRKLAQTILKNPVEISLSLSKPAEGVNHNVCVLNETQKATFVKKTLQERKHYKSMLIFTSTKSKTSQIAKTLKENGFDCAYISSNLDKNEREDVLRRFSAGNIRILIATDVVSRGIDVKNIDMVINYDIPQDAESYVHRVGRTARINTTGEAITLVTPNERHKLKHIENLIATPINKIEFFEDRDIKSRKRYPKKNKKTYPGQNRKKEV